MKRRGIYGLGMLIIGILILSAIPASAISPLGKKTDCYADSTAGGSETPAKACDGSNGTDWLSANSAYPHWLVVNLSALSILYSVALVWTATGYFQFNAFKIQVPNGGGGWTDAGSFSGPADCGTDHNTTYTLPTPKRTSSFRIYASSGNCANYADLGEVWPYGTLVTPDFSLSASNATVNLRTNTDGESDISASGTEGFTGNITLNVTTSNAYLVAVCLPLKIRVNQTPSRCILSAVFPGIYQVNVTGTNGTKVHSVIVDVRALAAGEPPTLDKNAWIFVFEGLAFLAFVLFGFAMGLRQDNLLWLVAGLVPAGMIMMALSFQAWAVTGSFLPSIAVAVLGIATIAYPIVMLLNGMISK